MDTIKIEKKPAMTLLSNACINSYLHGESQKLQVTPTVWGPPPSASKN